MIDLKSLGERSRASELERPWMPLPDMLARDMHMFFHPHSSLIRWIILLFFQIRKLRLKER